MTTYGIVSYNILNRRTPNIKMLLKNNKLPKKTLENLILNEKYRYDKIILPLILSFIKTELDTNNFVCLQEVNELTLQKIINKFSLSQVYYTTETDYTIDQSNPNHKNENKEFRVIIIPEKIIRSITKNSETKIEKTEIVLQTKKSRKNALMLKIMIGNVILVIINVHLHWTLNNDDLVMVSEKIYGEIKKQFIDLTKIKIIITGDFNKSIKKVENFVINSLNKNTPIKFSNTYSPYINDFTSHTTDIESVIPFDIIDHILISNIKPNGFTQIIKTINDHDIFISNNKLIDELTNNSYSQNYWSDHKIIKLLFEL